MTTWRRLTSGRSGHLCLPVHKSRMNVISEELLQQNTTCVGLVWAYVLQIGRSIGIIMVAATIISNVIVIISHVINTLCFSLNLYALPLTLMKCCNARNAKKFRKAENYVKI